MAYSQGFSPHPRVSWIGAAAPTGAASEAEYMEIQVVRRLDPEALRRELDAALPDGLDVVAAQESDGGSLADRIEASCWRIELVGVPADELQHAVVALMAMPHVHVEKLTKDGRRTIDARAALVSACVEEGSGGCGIMSAVVRQVTPTVRPDDVLSALLAVAGVRPTVPAKATRTAQGRLDDDGRIVDPLQHVDG
jgi:radical SAM-linked protein